MLNTKFISPLQEHAQHFRSTDVSWIETIEPYVTTSWTDRMRVCITGDRSQTIEQAESIVRDPHCEAFFTDGSARNGRLGVGVTHRTFAFCQTVRCQDDLTVYFAELFAIYQAVVTIRWRLQVQPAMRRKTIVVFSDGQDALQSLASPRQQSGQFVLCSIINVVHLLREQYGTTIEFRWVPAHAGS